VKSRQYGLGVAALVLLSQPVFATTVPGSGADELVMLGIAILCVGGFAGVVSGSMGMAKKVVRLPPFFCRSSCCLLQPT